MTATNSDAGRDLRRHTVATLAYRGGKVLRGAPDGFAEFRAGATARTPGQILAHLGDLLDWLLSQAKGKEEWHNSDPLAWDKGTTRFFAALKAFDAYLASDLLLAVPPPKPFPRGNPHPLPPPAPLAH